MYNDDPGIVMVYGLVEGNSMLIDIDSMILFP